MTFRVLNATPTEDYRQMNAVTQGRTPSPLRKMTDREKTDWWVKQIVASHSTLRCVHFMLEATAPRSVVMQLVRATKGHPQFAVESSRPDWTGKERGGDPYEMKSFCAVFTAESFIAMASQRLCARTEGRTRAFMEEAVGVLCDSEDAFLKAVGLCCMPPCVPTGLCREVRGCGKCGSLANTVIQASQSC